MRTALSARITRAPRAATTGVRWGPLVFRIGDVKSGSAWTGPVASFSVHPPIDATTVLADVPRRAKLSTSARKDKKSKRKAAARARRKNR